MWSLSPTGSWALRLPHGFTLGGRHEVLWLDTGVVRLRMHLHRGQLSVGLNRDEQHRDRLAFVVETQRVLQTVVDGSEFEVGGLDALTVGASYGFVHVLSATWSLGWRAGAGYARVLRNDQVQMVARLRPVFAPTPAHGVWLEVAGAWTKEVGMSRRLFLPPNGLSGQAALGYGWMSEANWGPWVEARIHSTVRAGELPLLQLRREAVELPFGTVTLGLHALWR